MVTMSEQAIDGAGEHRHPTVLEAAMLALSEEAIEAETLLWVMAASDLLLPEVDEEGGETVALVIEEDGEDYLALFTHTDQVPDMGDLTPTFREVQGVAAIVALPDDTGLAVNPGSESTFSVDPENIEAFREHLADTGLIHEH